MTNWLGSSIVPCMESAYEAMSILNAPLVQSRHSGPHLEEVRGGEGRGGVGEEERRLGKWEFTQPHKTRLWYRPWCMNDTVLILKYARYMGLYALFGIWPTFKDSGRFIALHCCRSRLYVGESAVGRNWCRFAGLRLLDFTFRAGFAHFIIFNGICMPVCLFLSIGEQSL